jgi:7,8-dihydro-6-hydroxymethylpterin-pyrophosphokinase
MMVLDHPTLLTNLIIASEAALQMRHASDRERLIDLAAAIENEGRKPTDRQRVIDDDIVMCAQAVLHADRHLRSFSRPSARPFCQVIGVLLPEVRAALEIAIEQRKRPTP